MSGIVPSSAGAGDASASNQTSGAQKTQLVDAGGEVATVTGGKLDVNASVDTTGLATSTIQTDGTQKSQIVDAGGEAVTVTGGKLDVNASVDTTGLATSAKQDTGNTSLASIDGKITAVNTGAVVVSSSALPTGAANQTKQDTGNASLASIDAGTPAALGQTTMAASMPVVIASNQSAVPVSGTFFQATQPVSAAALPLPSGAATSALQTQPGVDIGDVTINNASGGSAVNIQDGGNIITVDGTVTANTGLSQPLTDTQLRAVPVPVSGTVTVDTSLLSTAAKQDSQTALLTTIDGDTSNLDVALSTRLKAADTLAAVTLVGTVTAVTAISNALPAGNNNIGDVDVASIAAGTNIIGKVGIDQTTPGTTNGVQVNAALPAGNNNIGDVDVASVTGNVTVVQPTGTNLHTVIDSGVITTVSTVTSVTAIANQLPAGTNNIGDVDVATIAAGDNNIGNVDIVTMPAITGTVAVTGISADGTTTGLITAQDSGSLTSIGLLNQLIITGTATVNSFVSATLSGYTGLKVQVLGTWQGSLVAEQSWDGGTTWFLTGIHLTGSAYTTSPFTANFGGGLNVSGATNFRMRATSFIGGTASVTIVGTQGTNSIYIANAIRLQDTTTQSVQNVIKAANTQSTVTDNALVVNLSPNSGNLLGIYRQNEELLMRAYLQNIIGLEVPERASAGAYGFELR